MRIFKRWHTSPPRAPTLSEAPKDPLEENTSTFTPPPQECAHAVLSLQGQTRIALSGKLLKGMKYSQLSGESLKRNTKLCSSLKRSFAFTSAALSKLPEPLHALNKKRSAVGVLLFCGEGDHHDGEEDNPAMDLKGNE